MKVFFDKTQLPEAVTAILKTKSNVYAHAAALTKLVEQADSPDLHTLLCLANLELACAKSTELEEDLIDFGNNALGWLNKALEIEPENEAINHSISSLQKKIKKAEKSANEILSFEKENFDEMPSLASVNELAFYYYARCRKSVEFAAKGYKAYKYVYEKNLAENPDSAELIYYWHALTICKFEAEGYSGSETEIERLINWELKPESSSYTSFVTEGYWLKLFHFSEQNELESFRQLYDEWYNRMIPLEKDRKSYIALLELLNSISNWLLQQENTNTYLEYILENGYLFFNKKVLQEEHLEMISKIKHRLKN